MTQRVSVDVTPAERIAAIVIGVVGTVGGLMVIAGGASVWSVVSAVLSLPPDWIWW